MKKQLKKIVPFIKNKFTITAVAFIVWIAFFDKNDLLSQFKLKSEVNKLEQEKNYYLQEIKKTKNDTKELQTNPENLEKFAREKYFMKKENEEIFVIVEK
jgi:cell division protein FtsB